MRRDSWAAILSACRDIDVLVAGAVGDYPDTAPPRPRSSPPAQWPQQDATPAPATPTGTRRYPSVWPSRNVKLVPPSTPRAASSDDTVKLWAPGEGQRATTATGTGTATAAAIAPASFLSDSDRVVLAALHADVGARIAKLEADLAGEPGCEHAMRALVIYLDEHILGTLPEYLRLRWPLLQVQRYGTNTGGEDFFRLIDRLGQIATTPSFVFEVYYFCLSSGFQGQYADDLPELDSWKLRLRAHIATPEPRASTDAPTPSRQTSAEPIRSPIWYYLGAVALVVVVTISLTAMSNCS